jgi:hypothetical protein
MISNKEQLLQSITQAAEKNLVTKKEVLSAFHKGSQKNKSTDASVFSLTEVFSSLGCGIIFLGIAILVSQHWNELASSNKIIVTLGFGFVAYSIGLIFNYYSRLKIVSPCFFLLSALLIPMGIGITLNILGYDATSYRSFATISSLSLLLFFISFWIFKKDFFLLCSILYATWLFYSVANLLYSGINPDFNLYCTIAVGFIYLLLGSYFNKQSKGALSGFLYGFGSLGFLGSIFILDTMYKGSIWEWSFPFILFAMIYLSVRQRSVTFLTFGVIFLIFWILEITDRYFSASLGWPIALVVTGFLLIFIAYLYFRLKKKYFND